MSKVVLYSLYVTQIIHAAQLLMSSIKLSSMYMLIFVNFVSFRIHADGHLEYEGVVKIPKDILVTRLYYCYYVVKSGIEVIEEYIYCHSSEAKHRTMSVEHGKMRGKTEYCTHYYI